MLDIVEIARYTRPTTLGVPCASAYRPHALATVGNRNLSIVLSPSHEIKMFAGGVQTFSFRNARWHLIDLQAKYEMWVSAIGDPALAERLFQTALDLADSREGALFVVLRDAGPLSQLVAPADQLDAVRHTGGDVPTRGQLMHMLRGRNVRELDPAVLAGLARTDGATVMDHAGRLLAVGAILLHTEPPEPHSNLAVEGARTTAAMAAGRLGRGAQGERRRPDHVLRSSGKNLGYLIGSREASASSFPLPAPASRRQAALAEAGSWELEAGSWKREAGS